MKYLFVSLVCLIALNSVNAQQKSNIVNNNNDFAFSMFAEICKSDTTNVFISPISISSALAMAYDGAKGKTAKEMRTVLKFSKSQAESHREITDLLKNYNSQENSIFKIVNAAVAQEKYKFLESYFALLKDYNAEITTADFKDVAKREEARQKINKWVMDNTNNKIEELVDKSSLDELTRLVLLNAIYFKADWKYSFSEEHTRQMVFYGEKRQYIASYMNIREKFRYYQNDTLTVIEIPYKDNQASMYILFPAEGTMINDFSKSLTYSDFCKWEKNLNEQLIDLKLPKFKIDARYKLKNPLMSLGMISAFTNSANFGKMNGRSDLMIDEVIHQTFIEIDEKGTEAAGATAVVVREKSAPQPVYINLNRPFVFLIKENYKGSVLFLGKFNNPVMNSEK
jgi:serpin B